MVIHIRGRGRVQVVSPLLHVGRCLSELDGYHELQKPGLLDITSEVNSVKFETVADLQYERFLLHLAFKWETDLSLTLAT